jgi:GNAT superfamily N-acetyltransferase
VDGEHEPTNGHATTPGSGGPMHVHRDSTVDAYLRRAGDFLAAHEAENNLMFGICSQIRADPGQYESLYFATVVHGDKVVGSAIRTAPWRLILAVMDHPGAVHRLVDDVAGQELPGVVGPMDVADAFAEAWARGSGGTTRRNRSTRAFRLERVIPPRPANGTMVVAGEEHRAVLREWWEAFHVEAIGPGGPGSDYDAAVERVIRRIGRTVYLWFDGGRPVSLAGAGGLTPHGIRIGPVYTPPELRGRGYASNLVAQVSQLQLDEGRTFVFLFTDLANPTANKIYQAIGYEPVVDFAEWDFVSEA